MITDYIAEYERVRAKYEALGVRYMKFNSWLRMMLDPMCFTGASKVGPLSDDDRQVTITDCERTTTWNSVICAIAWYEGEIRHPAIRIRNRAKRIVRLLKAGETNVDAGDGYSA